MKRLSLLVPIIIIFLHCVYKEKLALHPQTIEIFYPEKTTLLKKSSFNIAPLFISLSAVGDIMIGGHVTSYLDQYGAQYPFDSTKNVLNSCHFTIGNLEAHFSITGKKFEKTFHFTVHLHYARGLV